MQLILLNSFFLFLILSQISATLSSNLLYPQPLVEAAVSHGPAVGKGQQLREPRIPFWLPLLGFSLLAMLGIRLMALAPHP